MIPLLLAAAGVAALGVAVAILRSFGPRYRVGRLLAVVEQVPVAEAIRLATAGERRYVRIDGRIDSDAEFEDEHHRPLVLRRTTIEWRPPQGSSGRDRDDRWRPIGTPSVELAPFAISEGLDEIRVDGAALAEGLVVVPRVHLGSVADLGDRAPGDLPAEGRSQVTIEQLSSVEHATVLGMPALAPDGTSVMGPGLGRPLILTTLERDEAMRVLTGGATGRSRLAVACLATGALLVAAAAVWWIAEALLGAGVAMALAASPDPTLRPGNDTRTPGAPAGFVGTPLLAIGAVLALGVLSVAATLAWIRFTGGRREPADRGPGGAGSPRS